MVLAYTPVAPDWLIARPIAHRGLHDAARAIVENTASAAKAAISAEYAIECDVQLSADGEAMVIHDFGLDRLTLATGPVDALSARELEALPLKSTSDHIQTLPEFLGLIGGRVPLICEIKSRFSGDLRLARRTAEIAAGYNGPLALKSFDPALMAYLQQNRRELRLDSLPLGMIGMADTDTAEWAALSAEEKRSLAHFLHLAETRPDFVSYRVDDLPHAVPFFSRLVLGLPIMCWTVRSARQKELASKWAHQIVFEGNPSFS